MLFVDPVRYAPSTLVQLNAASDDVSCWHTEPGIFINQRNHVGLQKLHLNRYNQAVIQKPSAAADKLTVKMMAEAAADRLANTPTISRSSYIHPSILNLAALKTDQRLALLDGLAPIDQPGLRQAERRLLAFLNRY